MIDSTRAIAIYLEAAEHNRQDPLLSGSVLHLPNYGQVVMTGDLHGHRRNFNKLQRFCDLERLGARHVMLHELIHEEPMLLNGPDLSHQLLLDAAKWKCDFPDQVHFLLSNHELAQILNNEITKNGRVVTKDFEDSVLAEHGTYGDDVLSALYDFIRSFPLAGRTRNRVWLSHSLPSQRDLPYFDAGILTRPLTDDDLVDRGSAHMMVWGRYQSEAVLTSLREILDVDYFICGHQPQEMGYDVLHSRMIILASEHNHGVFLPLDLNKPVDLDSLIHNIRPFAAIE